ncbi:MAG: hypothetical protein WBA28_02270, partial [Microbacteriaceae bacterium]
AYVVSASAKPSRASSAVCELHLVVTVPQQASVPVKKTVRANWKKWPYAGITLPVEIERNDPTKLRVMWDEVPSGSERADIAAAQLAEQMNSHTTSSPSSSPTDQAIPTSPAAVVTQSSSVTINGRAATPEEIAQYEKMTGMDLNGDGRVG